MRDPGSGDRVERFEAELREWGRRAPRIPASIARTRVVARLPEASRRAPWLRLAAAAALVVVLVVAVWRVSPRPAGEEGTRVAVVAQSSVDSNVVVWVLDSRTTVYFVLGPGGPAQGGVS